MHGIWNKQNAEHHQSSEKLANWLSHYLDYDIPIVDFGCGNGYYMAYLEKLGFMTLGIDGNNEIDILCRSFMKADLSKEIVLQVNCSIVSLEVGEHLPKESQETFVSNLVNSCKKQLVLSWAEIGQPGIGHINCRSQHDVITDIERRGFKLNIESTQDARNNIDDNCDWFRRTLLIFERI